MTRPLTARGSTRQNRAGLNRFALFSELDALAEPICDSCLVNVSRRDGEHDVHSVVDVGWVGVPVPAVEIDEQDQARPRGAFVAVGERMVPRKSARDDGCFVVRVGIEVLIAEACLCAWRAESARSMRLALVRVVVSSPVTCSANHRNSPRLRYRVTWRGGR